MARRPKLSRLLAHSLVVSTFEAADTFPHSSPLGDDDGTERDDRSVPSLRHRGVVR